MFAIAGDRVVPPTGLAGIALGEPTTVPKSSPCCVRIGVTIYGGRAANERMGADIDGHIILELKDTYQREKPRVPNNMDQYPGIEHADQREQLGTKNT